MTAFEVEERTRSMRPSPMQSVRLMARSRIRRIGGVVPQIAASFGIQHGSEHSQRMHPVLQTPQGHHDILKADPF